MMRYQGDPPQRILTQTTLDTGTHWTTAEKTNLANPGSAISGITLNNNRLLLAFNNNTEERDDLSLALSNDQGKTWQLSQFIEHNPLINADKNQQFAYPWLLQTQNGTIHLLYTWHKTHIKHVRFNPYWLSHTKLTQTPINHHQDLLDHQIKLLAKPQPITNGHSSFTLATLIGLSGISLLLSAILLRFFLFLTLNKKLAYGIISLFFISSFITIFDHSINIYFRGLLNDLSITTLILLSYYIIQPETYQKTQQHSEHSFIFLLIAIIGLFFYPSALGLGIIDPYSWGFFYFNPTRLSHLIFLFIIISLIVYVWWKNYYLLLLILVFIILAYQFTLLESHNFWDYLFDPLLFIYALTLFFYRINHLFHKH
jgi:hypothetical protein